MEPLQGMSPDGRFAEKIFLSQDTEGRIGEALERPPLSGIGVEFHTLTKPSFLMLARVSRNIQ